MTFEKCRRYAIVYLTDVSPLTEQVFHRLAGPASVDGLLMGLDQEIPLPHQKELVFDRETCTPKLFNVRIQLPTSHRQIRKDGDEG